MNFHHYLHIRMNKIFAQLLLSLIVCFPLFSQQLAYVDSKEFLQEERARTKNIEYFLDEIEKKYGVNFVYEPNVLKHIIVTYTLPKNNKKTLSKLLNEVILPKGLTYQKISDKNYVIKKVKPTKQSSNTPVQAIAINGKVTDVENLGIPGVTIVEKSTQNGTISDVNGDFKLLVQDNNAILVFTSVGFESLEIAVGNQTQINVTLVENLTQLEEIVVTAVGIEVDKASLAYSINNVDTEALLRSKETNLVSALSGKVAGVQIINSSGSPGASATIRIRGSRSLTGSNGPLFVIDGVPVSNSSSANGTAGVDNSNRAIDINPNDIEKLTVLKGPSATVLYGSRAANGAVMITTKSGSKGSAKIEFNSSFGISQVNKLPAKQTMYAQGIPDGGLFRYKGPETGENNSWGPLISELEFDGDESYPYDMNGNLVPVGTGNGVPANAYNDYETFFIKGNTFDQNLSVSGGNSALRYYFSAGHLSQTGVVPNATFKRTSIRSTLQATLTEKLTAGVSATYVNSGGNRIQRGSNISGVTIGLFRNPATFDIGNGKTGKEAANDPSSYIFLDNTQRSYRGNGGYDNPFWVVNNNPYEDNVDRIMGNVNVGYQLLPWIKLSYKLGLDNFTDSREIGWDVNSSSQPFGRVSQTIRLSNRLNSDFLVLINKDINEDINIGATLGHNYYQRHFESKRASGNNFSIPGFFDISNASEIEASRSILNEKIVGVFGDVKIGYKNMLYLNLSARNDWASSLPKDANSLLYPAGGIGFEFTELIPEIQNVVSYGKLRVSYGKVGNTPSIYQTNTYYSTAVIDGDNLLAANDFPFNGVNGFERSGRKANPEIRPEFTTTLEIGGDFKFFKNRIGLDATYYNAFTNDALVTATLSAASGYASIQRNAGDIENEGIEISLTGVPLKSTNGLNWNVGVVFSRNVSLVKALPDKIESIDLASFTALSSVNKVGYPYGSLSGTRYKRDVQNRMVIGADGWPLIDTEQGVIGDPNPDWTMGINNELEYKGIRLSFFWDIKKGGDMWNATKGVMSYLGVSEESGDQRTVVGYVYDGVVADANGNPTEQINSIPVDFANPALDLSGIKWRKNGFQGLAENYIEDASWIRLREVTLAYYLPQNMLDKIKIFSSASISFYGRNVLLFTKYSGIDPETNLRGASNAQGWDYFNMPNTREFGTTLNLIIK